MCVWGSVASSMAKKQLTVQEVQEEHTYKARVFALSFRKEEPAINKNNYCSDYSKAIKSIFIASFASGVMAGAVYASQNINMKQKQHSDFSYQASPSSSASLENLNQERNLSRKGTITTQKKNTEGKADYVKKAIVSEAVNIRNALNWQSITAKAPIRFSLLKPEYPPDYYDNIPARAYNDQIQTASMELFPLPMNVQNATVAYLTYVVRHKAFKLYSEQSPSGRLAITLSKGNHGALGFYFSLTF